MATYKLIQDIEAEDKILGPLTLKQFIFALIAAFFLYLSFLVWRSGVAFLLIVFLPPALIAIFFAFPFGKDQPTEVWALAKIRFLIKPRRRIWDQSGVKELVTINVPKKVERVLTKGLSQYEVHSRLKTLASTIDSRGWAIKNANVNLYSHPIPVVVQQSDRLVDISDVTQQVPDLDIHASDDILDATNNPTARQMDQMINSSTQARRQQIINQLNGTTPAPAPQAQSNGVPNDYWFLHQPSTSELPPSQTMFPSTPLVAPGTGSDTIPVPATGEVTPEEAAIIAQVKNRPPSQEISYAHLRTLQPLGTVPPPPLPPSSVTKADDTTKRDTKKTNRKKANNTDDKTDRSTVKIEEESAPPTPSKPQVDPAILSLANNNDLNVATLARVAHKAKNPDESQDEVVISLH